VAENLIQDEQGLAGPLTDLRGAAYIEGLSLRNFILNVHCSRLPKVSLYPKAPIGFE
jgi:hypothetical protein